jgi:hypothetical protein
MMGPLIQWLAMAAVSAAGATSLDRESPAEATGTRNRLLVAEVATFGAWDRSSNTVVVSPLLAAELPVLATWTATFQWGLVLLGELSDSEGYARLRVGNPAASMRFGFDGWGARWRVGAGIGLPVARLEKDDVEARRHDRNALAYAAGLRANRDLWLWAPERASLFLPVEATWRWGRARVDGRAAGAVLLPMGDLGRGVDLLIQVVAAASYVGELIRPGLRAQMVVAATQTREPLQLAVAPFAAVDLGVARTRVELTVPLGNPLAAFDLWSLSAAVEVVW